ncbi:hypothetical protein [Actinomyces oricola]|uniref:HD domain-containing protein n=1 Tax=Actinomyces oricola TaxID=206043 RepID=UPI000FFE744C|nr:hypothetical protein [Actinomyces oricola]
MGVIDAPQWLLPAYTRSVRAVGATAPAERINASGEALIDRWSTPDRHFHNLRHVIDLLARVDELADESHNPHIMRLAAWYHGCVFSSATEETYRRNGGEDEIASAAYAAQDLQALGVPDRVVDRICALILNLKRHNLAPNDFDALALNDADLGTLAVEPQRYKSYRQLVRQEYAHIPDEDYLRARLAIVSRLLDRDRLFSSPLGARWEKAARENLHAERQRLERALETLPLTPGDCRVDDVVLTAPAAPATTTPPRGVPAAPSTSAASPAEPSPSPGASQSQSPQDDGVKARSAPPRTSLHSRLHALSGSGSGSAHPQKTDPEKKKRVHHTASMESCVEDIDQLLGSPRAQATQGASAADGTEDRQARIEAERARLAEKVRRRSEEAKILREARTGEILPIADTVRS